VTASTVDQAGTRDPLPVARDRVLYLVGAAGLSFAITSVWLGMRAVLDIGGVCASGGPYVNAVQCPDSVALIMFLAFPIGFASAGLMAWMGTRLGGGYAGLVGLAWPALFLSLGWNFLQYGVSPPGGGGIVWGWFIPGVIFVLMGGAPLVAWFETRDHTTIVPGVPPGPTPRDMGELRQALRATGASAANDVQWAASSPARDEMRELDRALHAVADRGAAVDPDAPIVDSVRNAPEGERWYQPSDRRAAIDRLSEPSRGALAIDAPAVPRSEQFVSQLERLANLRSSGALSADQFEDAKRALLAAANGVQPT